MLSRALMLATVILSIGYSTVVPAEAQNLDAGKSPSQIFANTCSVCHRSQRGLLKTVPPGSLPGFLREHYTTSKDMAQQLSAFLLSNGATDNRIGGGRLTKQGEDAKSGRQAAEPAPADAQPQPQGRRQRAGQPAQEAARPDADGLGSADPRVGRTKRGRVDPQQAAPGPDGQPAVATDSPPRQPKQRLGKKKGREEAPKDTAAPANAAKPADSKPADIKPNEAATPEADRPAPAVEPIRPETPKPAIAPEPKPSDNKPSDNKPVESKPVENKPVETKPVESKPSDPAAAVHSQPATRPDPVPQVTPAPKSTEPAEARPAPAPSAAPVEAPAAHAPSEPPPRPTISVTPPPQPAPSGPATPPISQ